jgi:hypothetical protein
LSETAAVTKQEIGYRWHITIEKELRTSTGAKYPDKTVIHATLEGHEDSFQAAEKGIETAKTTLEKLTKNPEEVTS